MKRVFCAVIITLALTALTGHAQMMGGMDEHRGMMQGIQNEQMQSEMSQQYPPCRHEALTPGPMNPGMMGYGMGGYGMMGQGYRMGPGMGYGMMGQGMAGPGMMGGCTGYNMPNPCSCTGPGPSMMGQGYRMGPGMGYGMMGQGICSPGMTGYSYFKKFQKFLDETVDARKELHNKKFDYFEAVRNPDTPKETISKMEKELFELQKKIAEKAPRRFDW